jgi:dUTP pyrophosphatase
MKVKMLHPKAKVPEKAHITDAGWDLFSCGDFGSIIQEDFVIPPYELYNHDNASRMIRTGIAIELPKCPIEGHIYQAIIKGRSSLTKSGLIIFDGVIDNGYTGEILVKAMNFTHQHIKITMGMKIAQMILYVTPFQNAIEVTESLRETVRSDKGFGSTGI